LVSIFSAEVYSLFAKSYAFTHTLYNEYSSMQMFFLSRLLYIPPGLGLWWYEWSFKRKPVIYRFDSLETLIQYAICFSYVGEELIG